MNWTITYFSESVQKEILAMPAGFLGRYLRYSDRMEVFGPDLGLPHTRSMGEGLFELRESSRGNRTGLLLHYGWQKDRGASPVH